MAEKRRPDTVLWVRHAERKSMKVELFRAAQFDGHLHHYTSQNGAPIAENDLPIRCRMRVNGVWYPAGRRVLYTHGQALELLRKEIFNHETH